MPDHSHQQTAHRGDPEPTLRGRGSAKSLTKGLTCADAAGETLQSAIDVLVSFTEGPSGAR
jgi:hypothetical protein